jgi:hypothetical protein
LYIERKYGTTSWERLADLKERNLIEVAEYTVAKNFFDAPDFVWRVTYLLKKHIRIIDAVTKWYHKRNPKFGIEGPNSWDDCV